MSKKEFDSSTASNKKGLYSVIIRNKKGNLETRSYSKIYTPELKKASDLLQAAALLAKDPGFKKYLQMRAKALLTDDYKTSDIAWMDMKSNPIDLVIGPIENYEDQLFGYRAAFEAYVLIKDLQWSRRLAKYAKLLPSLQKSLPVPSKYKKEVPGASADLNAYDVIYYAGHSNAGAKTIAINLPNDEDIQLKKGTRRLQLKNIMRAKFEKILQPIAQQLISPEQLKHVTFNAFFANTMFHEVAHGLGIKKTINGRGNVRTALKEHASAIEEGKADILGLFMITELFKRGEMSKGVIEDNYVTFMAGIFRSIRFGASSAHGKANMIRFNFFKDKGAFKKDKSGFYVVNFIKMKSAVNSLSRKILTLQGDGAYTQIHQWIQKSGVIGPQLAQDLKKLESANIPVDIQVLQGPEILGL